MNKGIVLLPILIIAIVATGCNMEEKIGEKIAEELIEKSAGDEVEVNIDGEDVTYTTEDGCKVEKT
jgi:GTP cyclohydrolase I